MGVSHRTAPIALRDSLAVAAEELSVGSPVVLLSTCNRFEVYTAVTDPVAARRRLVAELARSAGIPERRLADAVTVAIDEEAVSHLFRVAAGLDSPILGEPQILGQVRSAAGGGGASVLLGRLFAAAVRAGRRARNETGLGERPGSLAAATVSLAAEELGTLVRRRVLVIGAGAIGDLVASSFNASGCKVVVASRTRKRADFVASRAGGRAVGIESVDGELALADVLVCCTRSSRVIVHADDVAAAKSGARRRLLVVDLAVPRDVDPAVSALRDCTLVNLDGLNARAGAANAPTGAQLAAAEAVVAAEVERFGAWRRSRDVAPAITSLRGLAESIRSEELARMRAKLDQLSPAQRRAVETMTAQIVNRLLHEPTVRVKEAAGEELVPALRRLFALEEAA